MKHIHIFDKDLPSDERYWIMNAMAAVIVLSHEEDRPNAALGLKLIKSALLELPPGSPSPQTMQATHPYLAAVFSEQTSKPSRLTGAI